jgi:hypothetical protein
MKRRSFVKSTVITTVAAAVLPQSTFAASNLKNEKRMYFELRTYTIKDASQQNLVENYFKTAAIPALNRLGVKNVGVFTELNPKGQSKIYAFIPFKSIQDFENITEKLELDKAYLNAGAAYLNATATAPAYERIESSLLKAFAHMPGVDVPANSSRIFELRRYEHPTEAAGKKKLEMFNDAGEIDIFKRLGFKPVFFGETIIGEQRPNLIYMVTFDDMESHGKHWDSFRVDPEWKKVSANPDYADAKLVSKITSTILKPLDCSQL